MDSSNPVEWQYTQYSYPEPGDDIAAWQQSYNYDLYDPGLYSPLYWPEGRPRQALHVLVAGCGTMQAAVLAFNNPECRFVGIDFSPASIAHEERLRERHNLTNLTLHRMQLQEVSTLGQSYDLIISSGVLHHLPDPGAGLRALSSVLEPTHGVMLLMLYGRFGRAGVYELQDAFRRMKVPQSPEGVAIVRSTIQQLAPHHPARWYYEHSFEMKSDAAVVDTFLHPQDVAYSVQDVLDFVEGNGLKFQGWLDQGIYNQDRKGLDESISDRDRWSIIEAFDGRMTTHSFIVTANSRDKRSEIAFEGSGWLDYYPLRHPKLSPSAFDPRRCVRGSHEFIVSPLEETFVAKADGAHTVAEILKNKELAKIEAPRRRSLALEFYGRMWRFGHMFVSAAPVKRERKAKP